MNKEQTLMRLIARGEEYLLRAMEAKEQENDIKYYYNLSHFFNIVDQIKKEIHLLDLQKYYIPSDVYGEALKLLNIVGDEE